MVNFISSKSGTRKGRLASVSVCMVCSALSRNLCARLRLNTTGPPGAGKTALAATIAMASDFPFIKLISPEAMVGFDEGQKIHFLNKVFTDSYKSRLSVVVVDNIERIVGEYKRA